MNTHRLPYALATLLVSLLILGASHAQKVPRGAPKPHLTRDDPPVYAFYKEPRGPVAADAKPGTGIHHINFGLKLKEQMDTLGLECTIRHADEKTDSAQEVNDFFIKHLLGTK